MRIIAPMMILIMMTSTLAGCTGGDPDSGGEMDTDAINDLIDQNLQDFINNTTITVNQEIHHHYYNNTTTNDYTVEYNNTTVNEGDSIVNEGDDNNLNEWSNTSYNLGGALFGNGVNGSVTGSTMMFVAHVEFSALDFFPDFENVNYQENTFTYSWTYYDYLTNTERNDTFSFSCNVFYLIGSLSNGSGFQVSFWEDSDNYWNAWDNEYNSTIADMLEDAGNNHEVRSTCDENYVAAMPLVDSTDNFEYNFLTIDVPMGYTIQYIQIDTQHTYYGCGYYYLSYYRCIDGEYHNDYNVDRWFDYSEGVDPFTSSYSTAYYGGWDNISIEYDLRIVSYGEYNGVINGTGINSEGMGAYSMWPSSEYSFTLYYRFVPVIPVV